MEAKRLNKFIADSGYCSRREADRLIAECRVRVDGRVGALGDQVQPGMRVEAVSYTHLDVYKRQDASCSDTKFSLA